MRNNSDERGAKLMNGNVNLRDYVIEADVQLLGQYGDAGLIIRASHEEEGVDAYDGYYAGLRDLDNTLILGRAGYGWIEYQARRVTPRVFAQQWYHLKVLAYECNIVATATSPSGQVTLDAIQQPDCIRSGRFGLKSYQTGGLWRNVQVGEASRQDLLSMVGNTTIPLADPDLWLDRQENRGQIGIHRVPLRMPRTSTWSLCISTCANTTSIPKASPSPICAPRPPMFRRTLRFTAWLRSLFQRCSSRIQAGGLPSRISKPKLRRRLAIRSKPKVTLN